MRFRQLTAADMKMINEIFAVQNQQSKSKNVKNCFVPDRILKSGNRTIVFWNDGTKTIVKRSEDTEDNDYEAFTAALAIKVFGSNSALKRIIKNKTVQQKPKKKSGCDACDISALLDKMMEEAE